ncbi:MAG: aldehyde ferredoxin oxidoreductase family protein [Promethearchaeota archaeon]
MESSYNHKILEINLNDHSFKEINYDQTLIKKFLGGVGLGIEYIMREKVYNFEPLSAENPLILMTGLLTGTTYPCSGFYSISARSPLTGIHGEGVSGGFFGPELRKLYNGLIFKGKSESPVYLKIDDDGYELRDASKIWGLKVKEAMDVLHSELDKQYKIALIGPSGEMQIPLACILNDHYRAVGRSGMGAVMGSKNLKAIAVKSSAKIEYYDEEKFKNITRNLFKDFKDSNMAKTMHQIGTNGIDVFEVFSDVPHQNWGAMGKWKGVTQISGAVVAEKMLVRLRPCYLCPFSCGGEVEVKEGPYKVSGASRPEYETVAAFGSMCLNDNIESIAYLNDLCNQYGVDTISTGCTVAFAIDLYNNGILTDKDIGFPLNWGDHDSIIKLTEMICKKEGIGEILSQGSRKAAKIIGKGADFYAVEIKGLEVPMHEPRANFPLGLQYATSNRGACHLRGLGSDIYSGFSKLSRSLDINEEVPIRERTQDNPKFAIDIVVTQNVSEINNSLGICRQTISTGTLVREDLFDRLLDAIYYLTGFKFTLSDLIEIGERIFNLKRLFNVKCGITKNDDRIPEKLAKTLLDKGRARNKVLKIDNMLSEYYKIRGWDENGIPTKERLNKLSIINYL